MRKQPLYLLLGTNLGDREANINEALRRLNVVFGERIGETPVMETEACGFVAPPFLNKIVVYSSARKPENILRICKAIERKMGRTDPPEYAPDGSRIYHDRIIDIDILFYGEQSINTPALTIPHPQVQTRPFVKELLANLIPAGQGE